MDLQYARVWQSYATLDRMYSSSTSGKLRYAAKQNAKRMAAAHEDIIEWLKADAMDNDWDISKPLPFNDKGFMSRFEDYLLKEAIKGFEPYLFTEELMQFADGINGEQENAIAWLFTENQPKQDAEGASE